MEKPGFLPGDMNHDNKIDGDDINKFVQTYFLNPTLPCGSNTLCNGSQDQLFVADVNENNQIDSGDLGAFVDKLLNSKS